MVGATRRTHTAACDSGIGRSTRCHIIGYPYRSCLKSPRSIVRISPLADNIASPDCCCIFESTSGSFKILQAFLGLLFMLLFSIIVPHHPCPFPHPSSLIRPSISRGLERRRCSGCLASTQPWDRLNRMRNRSKQEGSWRRTHKGVCACWCNCVQEYKDTHLFPFSRIFQMPNNEFRRCCY